MHIKRWTSRTKRMKKLIKVPNHHKRNQMRRQLEEELKHEEEGHQLVEEQLQLVEEQRQLVVEQQLDVAEQQRDVELHLEVA